MLFAINVSCVNCLPRFGRRYTMMGAAIVLVISGVITSYSTSVEMFMFFRFCVAVGSMSTFTTAYVYSE